MTLWLIMRRTSNNGGSRSESESRVVFGFKQLKQGYLVVLLLVQHTRMYTYVHTHAHTGDMKDTGTSSTGCVMPTSKCAVPNSATAHSATVREHAHTHNIERVEIPAMCFLHCAFFFCVPLFTVACCLLRLCRVPWSPQRHLWGAG